MRAAIYARMSTDRQSATSPADQIARCREFAAERGWPVLEDLVVEEAAVSGASRHNRPRLLDLIHRIADWNVLLCFEFSRLARDAGDMGWIRNRLRLHRRTAYEAATGLDIFNVGSKVMGVLNEEYVVKLRADTHRGLRGRVERKLFAGGTPYGYRTEPVLAEASKASRGDKLLGHRLTVDAQQAAVVRRIFALYLQGEGLRAIAHRLNAESMPPPRPRRRSGRQPSWTVSSLQGLLRNPIYRGDYVWNRSEWIKDHETGKRKRRERPESEWVRQFDPAWVIVDEATWERAQAHRSRRRRSYRWAPDGSLLGTRAGAGHRVRSRHLLSGLLECGECGGSFFAVTGGSRFGCGWHRDRGPVVCGNALRVPATALERRILGAIQDRILTPPNIAYAVEEALRVLRQRYGEDERGAGETRLAEIAAESRNLTRLVAKTGEIDTVAELLRELEEERVATEERLASRPIVVDLEALRPSIEAKVREMRSALEAAPEVSQAALRQLFEDRIRVYPDEDRGFRVEGALALEVPAIGGSHVTERSPATTDANRPDGPPAPGGSFIRGKVKSPST
jgi:DNA invertase Pin-like site-specific DNA recombinase